MRQDLKKERSRALLMESAYDLFISEGFHKTTIAMITRRAGLGKGTFYLYFRDKEDIRDSIIAEKSSGILQNAIEDLDLHEPGLSFYDQLTMIVDHIIDHLTQNKDLYIFISTSLSWGLHLGAEKSDEEKTDQEKGQDQSAVSADRAYEQADPGKQGSIGLEEFITMLIRKNNVVLKDERLFFYSVIELVYSTCYNPIIYGTPVSIEEFKPYLHHMIKLIADDQFISGSCQDC